LVGPPDRAQTLSTTPTLEWNVPADADGDTLDWTLELDTDDLFTGPFVETFDTTTYKDSYSDSLFDTTLGEARRKTYSPFLPICPKTGKVLQVPMTARDPDAGTITYADPATGGEMTTPVTGGRVKCQWKADWAMRWVALGVDYEMAGKDLIDSVRLSSQIARILGAAPPVGFSYELFLDETGEKISKSRGNGLTIDEWLAYASPESLSAYMFQSPRKAKRLYFDTIPRAADEYLTHLAAFPELDEAKRLASPVWHVHSGNPPQAELPISFNLLLNIVSASNAQDANVLWGFIQRYAPGATAQKHPLLDQLVGYAIRYFHDFVQPKKNYRAPSEKERAALAELREKLGALPAGAPGADIQTLVYEIGKTHGFEPLRDWFTALYEVLLGQSQGPRFGNFVELYGVEETRGLIGNALK
ncbi:MAG: lysine--tRNA ligase, partial [Proteobacteria bacterium]|nr:lysine--tRNA ligase [Pseudomonadota bacterium]